PTPPRVLPPSLLFTPPPPPAIHPPSLHDALPIYPLPLERPLAWHQLSDHGHRAVLAADVGEGLLVGGELGVLARHHPQHQRAIRSEEHTSELQSRENLVCRLLLEKKNSMAGLRYA